MKARIRKTGEIVDIINFSQFTNRYESDYVSYIDSKGVEHNIERGLNYYWDFEPIKQSHNTINWEQRRYEIAKAILQGLYSNSNAAVCMVADNFEKLALNRADALIKELKKQKLSRNDNQ